MTGRDAFVISVISIFSIINGALVQLIMASRVLYGMSNKGWLPVTIGLVHARTRTPVNAILIVVVITLLLALWLEPGSLARLTSFITLLIFMLN